VSAGLSVTARSDAGVVEKTHASHGLRPPAREGRLPIVDYGKDSFQKFMHLAYHVE
jgi:hypothetical protein